MKKILTSVFAAAALLFGLASCSGDLHDKELGNPLNLDGYNLVGTMTSDWDNSKAIPLVKVDGVDYKYTVNFTSTASDEKFAFIPAIGSWDGQIGGDQIIAGTESDDGISYVKEDNGFGGFNAVFKGLKAGSYYEMTVDSSSGLIAVSAKEKVAPVPFYLDGYFLEGAFVDAQWSADVANLLTAPEVSDSDGSCTYTLAFTAVDDDGYFAIVKKSDNSRFHGALEVGKDAIELENTTDGMKSSSSKGIKKDMPYFLVVVTKPDGTVTGQLKLAKAINIIGVQLVNLPEADYPAGTKMSIGGDQIGWPSNWDAGAEGTVDANGVVSYKLAEPVKLYSTAGVSVSILVRPETGWEKRIAKSYQADNGNGSFDISNIECDDTDYIIYADLAGLAAGEDVKWELIHPTYTVSVTGLPAAANTKKMYFTGGFNEWKTPEEGVTAGSTVANGEISTVISLATSECAITSEGKFAAAGWTKPEVVSATGGNVSFTITDWPQTIKGTYKGIKEGETEVYLADWVVE